jgi:hypothetical protein
LLLELLGRLQRLEGGLLVQELGGEVGELLPDRLQLEGAVDKLSDARAVGDGGAQVVGAAMLIHLGDQRRELGAIDDDLSLLHRDLVVGAGQGGVGPVQLLLFLGQLGLGDGHLLLGGGGLLPSRRGLPAQGGQL